MNENIASVSDPSVSFTATKKLKLFFSKNKEEIMKFKDPAPKNILELSSNKDVVLKLKDIEWLNSFLKHRKSSELVNFKPLMGQSLDKEIYNMLNNNDFTNCVNVKAEKKYVYLAELLNGSVFSLPKNEVIQRNPVLAARVEKLKREQGEKEYKAMTRNVDSSKVVMPEDTLAYQMNIMNRQLIAVGQFIISVGAGFAFGFIGIELLIGGLEFGFRLLLGIACALTIALAEFYFLAKHISNEDSDHSEKKPGTFQLNTSRSGKSHRD